VTKIANLARSPTRSTLDDLGTARFTEDCSAMTAVDLRKEVSIKEFPGWQKLSLPFFG
jgi:hypothetical protein